MDLRQTISTGVSVTVASMLAASLSVAGAVPVAIAAEPSQNIDNNSGNPGLLNSGLVTTQDNDQGGDQGGNQGGDQGSDQGSNQGDGQGSDQGNSQGNDQGGNQGGDQGSDQGSNQGGGQGGETQSDVHYKIEGTTLTITGDLDETDFDGDYPKWKTKAEAIEKVVIEKASTSVTFKNLFAGLSHVTSLDLTKLSMAKDHKGCDGMFDGCSRLKELKLSKDFRFVPEEGDDLKLVAPKETKWSNGEDAKTTAELVALYTEGVDAASAPKADYVWRLQRKADVTVTLSDPEGATYDGTAHEPQPDVVVTAKPADEDAIQFAASDYSFVGDTKYAYGNNVHAGEASVYVTVRDAHDGKGYLVWSAESVQGRAGFHIDQRKVHVTANDVTMVYDDYKVQAAQADLKPSMTYDSADVLEADKAKISLSAKYSCDWKGDVGTYDIKVGDVTFTNKEKTLSTAADDDADVASDYIVGEKTDGKLTITAADISNATVAAISDRTHTGAAITPTPVVTMNYNYTENGTAKSGSSQLIKDTDYTLSYANNTEVGTATITIKGKGNFTGEKKVNFKIKAETSVAKATTAAKDSGTSVSSAEKTPATGDPTFGVDGMMASGIVSLLTAGAIRKRDDRD